MMGLVTIRETDEIFPKKPVLGKRRICEMVFLEVEITLSSRRRGKNRRAIAGAAKKLQKAGVRRYVRPEGTFPWEELFRCRGLREATADRLFGAMVIPMTMYLLEEEGASAQQAIVGLCSDRTDGRMGHVAQSLCVKVRNLAIEAPDSEEITWALQRDYGLPVLEGGAGRGAVLLMFSSQLPKDMALSPQGGPILYLGTGAPALETERRVVRRGVFAPKNPLSLPEGWDASSLLSVLLEQGRISPEEVEIVHLA